MMTMRYMVCSTHQTQSHLECRLRGAPLLALLLQRCRSTGFEDSDSQKCLENTDKGGAASSVTTNSSSPTQIQ